MTKSSRPVAQWFTENQLLNPSVSVCNMSKWQDEKQKRNRQSIGDVDHRRALARPLLLIAGSDIGRFTPPAEVLSNLRVFTASSTSR